MEVGTFSQRKSTNHQHALFIHQEDPEDLLDTTIPSVEDIKIEQERTNCKGFEVRIYILIAPVEYQVSTAREESLISQVGHQSEKKECHVWGEWLNSAVENKEEAKVERMNQPFQRMASSDGKRRKKALREASPACDYERIRAANIAERKELLRTLDIEGLWLEPRKEVGD